MTFKNEQLQKALNFDSNAEKVFTDFERIRIHQAISYRLTYSSFLSIEGSLAGKISKTLTKIRETAYETAEPRYTEDKSGNKHLNNK